MTSAAGAARDFGRVLQAGRKAARAMWTRTRSPQVRGANETILEADAKRLAEWREWLKRAVRHPEIASDATPVCGAWQLQFMVHNFAPAVQKVIVEEFRAEAARPTTRLKRSLTVPVATPGRNLRLRVAGTGQVAISHVVLTNGVELLRLRIRLRTPKIILGKRAPTHGMPELAIEGDEHALLLDFARIRRG